MDAPNDSPLNNAHENEQSAETVLATRHRQQNLQI